MWQFVRFLISKTRKSQVLGRVPRNADQNQNKCHADHMPRKLSSRHRSPSRASSLVNPLAIRGASCMRSPPGVLLGAKLPCRIQRTPVKRLSEKRAPETYSYLALVPLHASFGFAHIQGRVVQPGEKHKDPASASAATACLAPPRVGTRALSALPEGPGKGSPGSASGGRRRAPRPAGEPAPLPALRSTFSRRRNAVEIRDGDTAPVPYPIKSLCSSSCLSGKREIPSSMSGSG